MRNIINRRVEIPNQLCVLNAAVFVLGNSPASTPGSSPRMGRKFQDGVPIGVSRLPRGPPQPTCKGFDLKFRRMALLNSTAAKLECGTFAQQPAAVK